MRLQERGINIYREKEQKHFVNGWYFHQRIFLKSDAFAYAAEEASRFDLEIIGEKHFHSESTIKINGHKEKRQNDPLKIRIHK